MFNVKSLADLDEVPKAVASAWSKPLMNLKGFLCVTMK